MNQWDVLGLEPYLSFDSNLETDYSTGTRIRMLGAITDGEPTSSADGPGAGDLTQNRSIVPPNNLVDGTNKIRVRYVYFVHASTRKWIVPLRGAEKNFQKIGKRRHQPRLIHAYKVTFGGG